MATVEDILSNPGSSWFYLNHRFSFAIGNTRSVDLSEGCEVPSDAQFLLLGCGDIRNILYTVHEVTDIKPLPTSLTFHLNDIDDVVLARDAVLLRIVDTIDSSNATDLAFLWNVWYNINLTGPQCQRLKCTILDILERPLKYFDLQSAELLNAVKHILKYWLTKAITLENIQLKRERFICKEAQYDNKTTEKVSLETAVSPLYLMSGFYANLCLDDPHVQEKWREEAKRFFRTGSTDENVDGFANPTLLCPHIDGWRLHHNSLPFAGFNELMFDKISGLTENCIRQLQSQLESWKKFKQKGSLIKIVMWSGDALSLCHRRLPLNKKFDFISTSNICDHITVLNVLLAGSKRLKSSGVLTMQTMHFFENKDYATVDDYLEKEVGIPSGFYPTFLGLKLADDFNLGTSKFPKHYCGNSEVSIRWLSVGKCTPCIDLEGSTTMTQIFKQVISHCFESSMLVQRFYDSPLTAIYLIMELSSKLRNGVKPLLEIAQQCLPQRCTISGEQFSPLELEWRMLTMFYFTDELHPEKDDFLLAISVSLAVNKLYQPKNPPASFHVLVRAVTFKGTETLLGHMQGPSLVPWSSLSLVHYDYQTCTMTCVLPKSQVQEYGLDMNIWPIPVGGGISPLLPTGSYQLSSKSEISLPNSPSVLLEKTDEKEDDPRINLKVRETEEIYRITLSAKVPQWIIKQFEIQVGMDSLRKIRFKCDTLASRDEGMRSSTHEIIVPCEVEPPQAQLHKDTHKVELKKSQASLQGPLILPFRRMNVSANPAFPKSRKEVLFRMVRSMFSSEDDIRRKKAGNYRSADTLSNLKDKLEYILKWSIDPPKERPKVMSYLILRGSPRRSEFCKLGYFPNDIFLSVRKLCIVHGLPMLDVVWIDFENFQKQVSHEKDLKIHLKEMFLLENGGLSNETCYLIFVSREEADLLKKILQVNTRRSVQTVYPCGSPTWCFSSFLQPVYTVAAERDSLKLLTSDRFEVLKKTQTLAKMAKDPLPAQYSMQSVKETCDFCGETELELKKCSNCKSVFYCGTSCQKMDWKLNHKMICMQKQVSDTRKNIQQPSGL